MKALIDGDILVYRVGFAANDVPVGYAFARMDTAIENICKALETTEYTVYLTSADKSNFRFDVFPEYKGNRTQPKPVWYHELREHLRLEHNAEMVFGREADDAMADAQTDATCICTIDKDLDQVVGKHYDFVKDVQYEVLPERAVRFFYYQLLSGDRTDNIAGIEGVGPKGAARVLEGATSESEWRARVEAAYHERYGPERGTELMLKYGRCLKIGGDVWDGGLIGSAASIEVDWKPQPDPPLSESDSPTSLPN